MGFLRFCFRRAAAVAVILGVAALAGCISTKPLKNEPLTWSPSDTLDLGARRTFGAPATVHFRPFMDAAARPSLIGKNVEKHTVNYIIDNSGKRVPIPRLVTTSDKPGPFVSKHLQDLFAQAGYSDGGANAQRVITGVVHKFFVREGGLYEATLDLSIKVHDRNGKVLWQGTVEGNSSTFGRSYSLENYQQVLSNSVVSAADKLLKNPSFSEAIALPGK